MTGYLARDHNLCYFAITLQIYIFAHQLMVIFAKKVIIMRKGKEGKGNGVFFYTDEKKTYKIVVRIEE